MPDGSDAALSPDRRLLAGIVSRKDAGQQVWVWDAATGRDVQPMEVPTKANDKKPSYLSVLFTLDGRRVISCEAEIGIEIWEVATGKKVATLAGQGDNWSGLTVSPDGRWLATHDHPPGGNGCELGIWDLATYKRVQRFPALMMRTVAFAPDSRRLAYFTSGGSGVGDTVIHLVDIETGRSLRTWRAEQAETIAFSPDGRTLATGGYDAGVTLLETATGGERHRFAGHGGGVGAIAFAPDGRTLAAASNDAPVYIWDVLNVAEFAGRPPNATELEQAWAALADSDAKAAFRALRRLVAAPDAATAFLHERLKHDAPADAARVRALIGRLDSPRFVEREQATVELEKLGDPAAAEMRAALGASASAEVRQRLQRLLDRIDAGTPESVRAQRAVEALEYIATAAARTHLKGLAGGAAGHALTDAAAAALKRLER
jgi:dipeptidyl aminopeptidase/acylaminoacyl peptidase